MMNLSPTQKLIEDGNGVVSVVNKSPQELISEGKSNLQDYKNLSIIRLSMDVTQYLMISRTTSGYSVNDYSQKIAQTSLMMMNTPDSDPSKKLLMNNGLLYDIDKTHEIIEFLGQVMAAYESACKAVEKSTNVAGVDSVKFISYV